MLRSTSVQKPIARFFIAVFLVGQLATLSAGLLMPKKAEAWVFPTITMGNVWNTLKDIGIGAMRQVALQASNKFLTKLVAKLQDKYKIRSYLYYNETLTAYLLSTYISDKIDDPDLRQIYGMLHSAFITGQSTGTTGQPNPNNALVPQLNKAISKYYLERQGGINPDKIYNPAPGTTDREYFATAQAYFSNPPSFTEQNLRAQFGSFQSAATTAAQLEIIVGNGLKAGRIVGGTCKMPTAFKSVEDEDTHGDISSAPRESWLVKIGLVQVAQAQPAPLQSTPITPLNTLAPTIESNLSAEERQQDPIQRNTPVSCEAGGGTWQPSALDQARAFIDNPTAAVQGWLDGAIKSKLDANFDPNNFWAVIGSLAGSYIFNQVLNLDKANDQQGVLNEYPNYVYDPSDDPTAGHNIGPDPSVALDIDGDGIGDGYDYDNDGDLDVCTYGGVDDGSGAASAGPPCKGSRTALSGPAECTLQLTVNNQINSEINSSVGTDPNTGEGTGSASGTATGSATGTVGPVCEDDLPPPGGGECSYLLTEGGGVMAGAVSDAMRAVLAEFGGVPADQGSTSAYRDAVVDHLNANGFQAARGYNGNCNSSINNLGIQVNAMTGEMYDMVRIGAMCAVNGNGAGTIAQHVDPCRLPPIGYTGTWAFISTGER